ncbi:MAG: quinone-dependent dihydroorotate dehydrogenase [Opitutales bacterium]|nr:quinone-dependent dihydroorotate dehydrogenase [Opitutales bacterium]
MDYFYESLIRPIVFKLFRDAEKAHDQSLSALKLLSRFRPAVSLMEHFNMKNGHLPPQRPIEVFGLKFPNVVGLAAGFDKQARVWPALGALGFGHVEIGTVTQQPQPGNEKPRVFRYPQKEAVVNSFGFPNDGADVVAERISKLAWRGKGKRDFVLGINIGKSKVCPLDKAVEDYLASFKKLAPLADYMVVNISSPNTPNLRELHNHEQLYTLLSELQHENRAYAQKTGGKALPLLLKIAPDLTFPQIDAVLEVVSDTKISGLIATNTTVTRPADMPGVVTKGGLSGAPLFEKALDIVRYIVRATDYKLPVIGSGGICSVEDVDRYLAVGASLVQIYSGMIYRGPFFASEIAKAYAWNQTDIPHAGQEWGR